MPRTRNVVGSRGILKTKKSMKTAEIAKYIQDKRVEAGLSRAELAVKAKCGRLAIYRIENNITIPNVDLLTKLLNTLDVDLVMVPK